MALTLNPTTVVSGGGATPFFARSSTHHLYRFYFPCPFAPLCLSSRSSSYIVAATGKFTSRTGKFDSKNRRSSGTTIKEQEERKREDFVDTKDVAVDVGVESGDDGYFLPELPGNKPDFWEGSKWDALGFFVQYMWAFGIVFALIACGIAVATYNEGATDFRETPAYKESVQSKDLLDAPDTSDSDVFESNPTEEAMNLE